MGISGVFAVWYVTLRKQLNMLSVKAFFIFLGLTFLYFLLLSLSSLWYIVDVRWNFALVAFFALAGGVLYARVMFVHRDTSSQNIQTDILLTFFLCFLGMASYYLGYSLWSEYILEPVLEEGEVAEKTNLGFYASLACLPFLVPFLVQLSYQFLNAIPEPIYPKWYYPIEKDPPPFNYGDGDPQTKANLQFSTKEVGGQDFARVTLIPNEMILGEFMHSYFDAWNDNQETSLAMELTDDYNRPYAFRFYVCRKETPENRRRLDPGKTVLYNKLKNDDLIVIERESRYV